MSGIEITNTLAIALWLLAGASLGSLVGFYVGRLFTLKNESRKLAKERHVIQESLVKLIDNTKKMTVEMDSHQSTLADVEKDVKEIESGGNLQSLQDQLLLNIDRVVETNRKMENDLAITKYQFENQAQELDRSRKEARTDGLCNVGNRKAFEEAINYMLCRYRVDKTSFGLMLVDLDHFKRINDTFGHQAGDEVLANVGRALSECVRPEDVVTRIGGDEFAILLKGVTNENADLVGSRIRSTIELYSFSIGDGKASTVVTTSMGMAVIGESEEVAELYRRADKALYRSKELGRNRMITITEERPEEKTGDVPALTMILPTDTLPNNSPTTI